VQISVAETVGVEGRGSYFDHAGSLRDMVPNHIMQLISLTTMEPQFRLTRMRCAMSRQRYLHAIQPMRDEKEVLNRERAAASMGKERWGENVFPPIDSESDVAPGFPDGDIRCDEAAH